MQFRVQVRYKIQFRNERVNPVRRGYVDLPEHWRYSSARNYETQDYAALEIDPLPLL